MTAGLTFIDWFAGVGGFALALERAGMRRTGAVEIDPFARRVYIARFGAPLWFPKDINTVTAEEIPTVDLWCGGSPCSGFSVAGKRRGLEDPRSGLLRVWMDLLDARKPRFLLFENVFGIFSANGGRDWGEFIARLDEIGYSGSWVVRDARWFGVPQRRRRVFLIAERGKDAGTASRTLFESGEPFSPPLFRKGYIWKGGQGSLFDAAPSATGDGTDWGSGGRWAAGRCETATWPEAPAEPVPSSLAALLEREAVPARFFLSPRAAAGILRRAAKRGRELPTSLRAALDRVALADVPDVSLDEADLDEADDIVDEGDEGAPAAPTPAPSAASPIDGQSVVGALTSTYGNGTEVHPERMGRDSNQLVIGFSMKDHGQDAGDDISPTVRAGMHRVHANSGTPPAVAFVDSPMGEATAFAVRGGSPRGDADASETETSYALMARSPKQKGNSAGMLVVEPEAFQQHGSDVGRMGTLRAGHGDVQSGVPFVEAPEPEIYQCHGNNVGPTGTLRGGNGHLTGGVPFVEAPVPREPMLIEGDSAASTPALPHLRAGCGRAGETYMVPAEPDYLPQSMTAKWAKGSSGPAGDEHHNLVTAPLPAEPLSFDLAQITHPENRTRPEPGQPAPALASTNRVHVAGDVAGTVRASDGHHGHFSPRGDGSDNLVPAQGVRRLTPAECEKLQGLTPGHTCLCGASPYATADCTCPDGPRYRVVGNGVAVLVVEWIARRLVAAVSADV